MMFDIAPMLCVTREWSNRQEEAAPAHGAIDSYAGGIMLGLMMNRE